MATDNRQLTTIASAGHDYYNFRAALMVRNSEGLTKTYNRFQTPLRPRLKILEPAGCTTPWTTRYSTPTAGAT